MSNMIESIGDIGENILSGLTGGLVGGPFGKKKKQVAAPAPAPAQLAMPEPDDEAVAAARRRKMAQMQQRGGRSSTILSNEDRLGG